MAESVGEIGLDLVVNQNQFNKQMGGIQKLAKKAGAALAAAFAVKKLVDFGKKCIDLGSELQEVQNVVDVTFPSMTKQVNEFAQAAAVSFGLSETMAKRYSALFGTMAKQFGFSERAAYDMGTTLAGLAGDVASFYDMTQDEAYTKLKAVFSGETEVLKDIGVVMTQTALDAFAMANGYGKTTSAMSEAEKVALRYAFVQKQLTAASGDFLRTSDGWANQVRVLKLQFDSLKATIGQGLINVLTPVLKIINSLISRLMVLANAFKAFTEMISGKKADAPANAMNATAEAATAAAGAIGAAAASAKKMRGLFSFDEAQVANKEDSAGAGAAGTSGLEFDYSGIETGEKALAGVDEQLSSVKAKAKELAQIFREGFREGLGDAKVFDSIRTSVQEIKESLQGIFTDGSATAAAEQCSRKIAESLGKAAGSAVSIGASVCDNLLGGVSGYLQNNSSRITEYIVEMFDISGRIADISGNFSAALGTIAESLRSEGAKSITESIIGIFGNGFMGVTELAGEIGTDILDTLTAPFIENADAIKTSMEGTFSALAPIFSDIRDIVDECFGTMQAVYDEHIHPVLTSLRDGFVEIQSVVSQAYDNYILPVLEELADRFGDFKDNVLTPLIVKFGEFAGKVADAVLKIWTVLQPAIETFINEWYPVIAEIIRVIGEVVFQLGEGIGSVIGGVLDALGGLIDFLVGVFTGDWNSAWEGIKGFFKGIWDAIVGIGSSMLNALSTLVNSILCGISNIFHGIWNGITQFFTAILNGLLDKVNNIFSGMKNIILTTFSSVKNFVSEVIGNIYTNISNVLNKIKTVWSNVWNNLKTIVTSIFDSIWSNIKRTINSILFGIESMANGIVRGINRAIDSLNRISFSIPSWVPQLGGMSFGFSVPRMAEISIPKLAQGGYVKPNTPQLAMIGDNRHQGEVVAPEDKLYEVSHKAISDVMGQFMNIVADAIKGAQSGGTVVIKVNGEMASLVRLLKLELEREESRAGMNFEVIVE